MKLNLKTTLLKCFINLSLCLLSFTSIAADRGNSALCYKGKNKKDHAAYLCLLINNDKVVWWGTHTDLEYSPYSSVVHYKYCTAENRVLFSSSSSDQTPNSLQQDCTEKFGENVTIDIFNSPFSSSK